MVPRQLGEQADGRALPQLNDNQVIAEHLEAIGTANLTDLVVIQPDGRMKLKMPLSRSAAMAIQSVKLDGEGFVTQLLLHSKLLALKHIMEARGLYNRGVAPKVPQININLSGGDAAPVVLADAKEVVEHEPEVAAAPVERGIG